METRTKTKLMAIFGGLLLVVASFAIGYTIAQSEDIGFTTVIEPGSLRTESTHIVFRDGSNYFVRNGTTGAIIQSNSDAEVIIEYAINNLPESGGAVYLAEGIYSIPATLNINSDNVTLRGVGPGTKLELSVDTNGIYSSGQESIVIRDLWMEGPGKDTGSNSLGITLTDCAYCSIEGVILTEWPNDAILITGADSHHNGVYNSVVYDVDEGITLGGNNNIAIGNRLYNSNNELMEVEAPADGILISQNTLQNAPKGILIYQAVTNTSITSNTFLDMTNSAISIESSGTSVYNLTVADNLFSNTIRSVYTFNGGWRDITVTNNVMLDTLLSSTTTGSGLYILGNTIVLSNAGAGTDGIIITTASSVMVSDNVIRDSPRYGIRVNTDNSVVDGNAVYNAASNGYYFSGMENSTVVGNILVGFDTWGMYFSSTQNNTIIGNRIDGEGAGIAIKSIGSDYLYIGWNNFRGCATGTQLSGTNNVVSDNIGP